MWCDGPRRVRSPIVGCGSEEKPKRGLAGRDLPGLFKKFRGFWGLGDKGLKFRVLGFRA